jgi:hypothetical protein
MKGSVILFHGEAGEIRLPAKSNVARISMVEGALGFAIRTPDSPPAGAFPTINGDRFQESGMASRTSPRFEPERIHKEFCDLMKQEPGTLKLSPKKDFYGSKKDFHALVGQFVATKRKDWLGSREFMAEWEKDKKKKTERLYIQRQRKSIYDRDLLKLMTRLFTNYAAWIILSEESRALKKEKSDAEVRRCLESRYGYLSQVKSPAWFGDLHARSPKDLALRDTAVEFKIVTDEEEDGAEILRAMLSPSQMRRARPWWYKWLHLSRGERLENLTRIAPGKRTRKDKLLLRLTEQEVE